MTEGAKKKAELGPPDAGCSKAALGPCCSPLLRNLQELPWTPAQRI